MIKLAFLLHKNFEGRFRVKEYIPYFEAGGIEVDIIHFPEGMGARTKTIKSLGDYDVVIVQRLTLQLFYLVLLKIFCRRLIFDFDDAIMYRSSRHQNQHSVSRMFKFKTMLKTVDGVIAGNDYLANEAKRFISPDKVHIIPTVVDLKEYDAKDHDDRRDDFIIGWLGSRANLHYLEAIAPALEELGKRYREMKLKIVCDSFIDLKNMEVIKKKWKPGDVNDDLMSFDVGLMPLDDDLWTKGKCGFKIVQYLASGVPAVVSPVGVNRELVRHSETGFWAKNEAEWVEAISKMMEDRKKRKEMGMRGRELIEERFSLQKIAPRYIEIIKKMAIRDEVR